MAFRISVDTGGTFSDVIVADETGIVVLEKALTTPERIFLGMRAAMELAARQLGLRLEELLAATVLLIYGTTRAANAIVEGKTAKTAMLLTEGFPDILVLREGGKYRPHDFSLDYPAPYVPRRHTFEIGERISSEGEVVRPLDLRQASEVLDRLADQQFEAIGVCLFWSVVNPAHELALAALIDRRLPSVPYTLSHRLLPVIREYRRASATAIDASLKPLMQHHLREMEDDLRASGFRGDILVSTSVGGCMHVEELALRPIHTVKSGPAMAPVAGRRYAAVEGLGGNVIVCDAGGTTFDVGLVRDGEIVYTRDTWIGPKWTGHIMSMSTVDVRSIGAGGGSVAWVDQGGLLRVGPQSAGSVPGPSCYGRGGHEATLTDAALILGYLDADFFLGGRMTLHRAAARQAVAGLAVRLGLGIEETALAIVQLANEHMINAIREITINEGIDPRESTIVAGGGAAGLTIGLTARELGCRQVVIPRTAAALSACGMQFSDILFEHSASGITLTSDFDRQRANQALGTVREELHRFRDGLRGRGVGKYRLDYFVEARYLHQVWELEVPLPVDEFRDAADVAALVKAFHQVHDRLFAVVDDASAVECLNWKGRITVHLGNGRMSENPDAEPRRGPVAKTSRPACFAGGIAETPVYLGAGLAPGASIVGPAIIQEQTTTIIVFPGISGELSPDGNYRLTIGADEPAARAGARCGGAGRSRPTDLAQGKPPC
jgi:N-methylhydantoinase A